MKNLKITWKIILLIVLMSAFTLGVGYIGVSSVSDLRRRAEDIAVSGNEALLAARLNQSILALNRAEYRMAADPESETLKEVEQTFSRQKQLFAKHMETLLRTAAPEQKRVLAQIHDMYQRYERETAETLAIAKRVGGSVVLSDAQEQINKSVVDSRAVATELQRVVAAYAENASDSADAVSERAANAAAAANTAMLIAAAVGVLIGVAVGLLIGIAGIGRPLSRIIEIVVRLSRADTSVHIFGADRRDEVGDIARAMEVFKGNLEEKTRLEAEAAEQRRIAEEQRAAREARERKAIEEISALCEKAVAGDLSTRIDESGKEGFLLTISQRLNGLAGLLQQMTGETAATTAAMARGDLTGNIRGNYQGVFGTLKDSVNTMAAKLRDIAGKLNTSAQAVKEAAGEISTGSQDLAQRTESQAASIEETAASMHEITTK
ncbi:HAMP domain-containing protein [Ferrovibrio sp.]|uniref:HAMP domain-containing protein n=1 Tax=Ferrovibrio sp. TaxID=1917215 RepID=UPI002ED4D962